MGREDWRRKKVKGGQRKRVKKRVLATLLLCRPFLKFGEKSGFEYMHRAATYTIPLILAAHILT